jgi:glutamyl-Q tRNA(Asp) synthetase
MGYVGRFAPSPTGALHAGSLVAALASWLDARAHRGRWLVRIEDVDRPRCVPGADVEILMQLAAFGLVPDEPPVWQSRRSDRYEAALARLVAEGWAYPCGCTRAEIAEALAARGAARERHADLVYPGTCRSGLAGKPARAARLLVAPSIAAPTLPLEIEWHDRRLGAQRQRVSETVGDFVLRRADGLWAYQLAVVVDADGSGRQHAAPDPSATRARVADARLPAHAAGARRRWRETLEAERRDADRRDRPARRIAHRRRGARHRGAEHEPRCLACRGDSALA